MTLTVESVVALAWPDLREMDGDSLAELEKELVGRLQPSRVLAPVFHDELRSMIDCLMDLVGWGPVARA